MTEALALKAAGLPTGTKGEAASDSPVATPCKSAMQTCEDFCKYLTDKEWNLLEDTSKDFNSKVDCLVGRCLAMGLKNPSEQTVKLIVACLVVASKSDMSPVETFEVLTAFKLRCKTARAMSPVAVGPRVYFGDPVEFVKSRGLEDTHMPAIGRADEANVRLVAARIPARRTNNAVVCHTPQKSTGSSRTGAVCGFDEKLDLLRAILGFPEQSTRIPMMFTPKQSPRADARCRTSGQEDMLALTYPVPEAPSAEAAARSSVAPAADLPPTAALPQPAMSSVVQALQGRAQEAKDALPKPKAKAKGKAKAKAKAKPEQPLPKAKAKAKAQAKAKEESPKPKAKCEQPQPKAKAKAKASAQRPAGSHTAAESQLLWKEGQLKLGDAWRCSEERQELIRLMPYGEKQRRRF